MPLEQVFDLARLSIAHLAAFELFYSHDCSARAVMSSIAGRASCIVIVRSTSIEGSR